MVYLYVPETGGFIPMGAYLPAQKTGWDNDSWFKLVLADTRSDYPGTVLSNGGVAADGGMSVVSAQAVYAVTDAANRVRILVNNGVVDTGTAGGSTTKTASWTGQLNAGDVVTLEAYGATSSASDRKIMPGQTTTYLTITPV